MTQKISALFDGELDANEVESAVRSLHCDAGGRRAWSDYCLVNDALRREPGLDRDLTAKVMAAISEEPVILAPRPVRRRDPWRPVAALAASLAGVAVVGWMAATLQPPRELSAPGVGAKVARADQAKPADRQQMQEYLVAHQSQASGLQFMGAAQNVRTVAATARGGSR